MRLEPIAPAHLTPEQKSLHDQLTEGIQKDLHGFTTSRPDGALIGPFPAMVHFPQFGSPAWSVFTALAKHTTLPKPVHEIAILVTGARLHSLYEVYAHERVAALAGLAEAKIATITAGQRPPDLTPEEGLAYDVASTLSAGGQLSDTTYRSTIQAFGDAGTAELFYLIGCYQLISTLLNGYGVPIPE